MRAGDILDGTARVSTAREEVVLRLEGVSKKFSKNLARALLYSMTDVLRDVVRRSPPAAELRPDEFWAVKDVSFELRRGESLGVMGGNGAGKSTLLKLVLGSLRLSQGRSMAHGQIAALSEHGLGFHPVLTGRENIFLSAAVLNIDRRKVERVFDEIVAFADLGAFIDSPVQIYSTGMQARLGFAVAMCLEPEILLVDEVLTVGDVGFQRRCIEHTRRFLAAGGSLVLVSHNPLLVQFMCDRCIVLDHGRVAFDGDAIQGVARYLEATRSTERVPALDATLGGPSRWLAPSRDQENDLVIEAFGIEPTPGSSLKSGGGARVYLRYRAKRALTVSWGFTLLTADLATTICCDGPPEVLALAPGAGELAGTLPHLPLAGGRYALRVAIMDPATDVPFALAGFYEAPCFFGVETPATSRSNYRTYTRDLIVLDGVEWETRTG